MSSHLSSRSISEDNFVEQLTLDQLQESTANHSINLLNDGVSTTFPAIEDDNDLDDVNVNHDIISEDSVAVPPPPSTQHSAVGQDSVNHVDDHKECHTDDILTKEKEVKNHSNVNNSSAIELNKFFTSVGVTMFQRSQCVQSFNDCIEFYMTQLTGHKKIQSPMSNKIRRRSRSRNRKSDTSHFRNRDSVMHCEILLNTLILLKQSPIMQLGTLCDMINTKRMEILAKNASVYGGDHQLMANVMNNSSPTTTTEEEEGEEEEEENCTKDSANKQRNLPISYSSYNNFAPEKPFMNNGHMAQMAERHTNTNTKTTTDTDIGTKRNQKKKTFVKHAFHLENEEILKRYLLGEEVCHGIPCFVVKVPCMIFDEERKKLEIRHESFVILGSFPDENWYKTGQIVSFFVAHMANNNFHTAQYLASKVAEVESKEKVIVVQDSTPTSKNKNNEDNTIGFGIDVDIKICQ